VGGWKDFNARSKRPSRAADSPSFGCWYNARSNQDGVRGRGTSTALNSNGIIACQISAYASEVRLELRNHGRVAVHDPVVSRLERTYRGRLRLLRPCP
jgi:hypothetical protein